VIVGQSRASDVTYPHERETDIALRDGATAHMRPIRLEDEAAVRAFLEGLSPESIGFRFFGSPSLKWATRWSLDVDYADRFGLVAVTGDPPVVVAHATYARMNERKAEVAFLVADAWRERGISTILLAHLAEVADHHGITTFVAEVLPHNHRMIGVFRASGFPVDMRSTPDATDRHGVHDQLGAARGAVLRTRRGAGVRVPRGCRACGRASCSSWSLASPRGGRYLGAD
jgi:acetate---CoA ligase (ADP-forming)